MQIAIVGAGVNGLYLSWKLSEMGHKVIVFERKTKIGDNVVCSGLFSERIFDFIPESRKLAKNKINYVKIHFPKKTVNVNFLKSFFVLDHSELDKLLAKKTKAKIILGRKIEEVPLGFDKIIGCDGANSVVRKNLNFKSPEFRLGFLKIRRGQSPADFVDVWPCKTGFSWKIPRGDSVEIGQIADFWEVKKSPDLAFKVIPQGLAIPKDGNITLCGDAAGLTKPWSGGGVVWGLTAADILLKSFPDFKKYRKEARRFFIPKIVFSKFAVKAVNFCGSKIPFIFPKKVGIESDFLL